MKTQPKQTGRTTTPPRAVVKVPTQTKPKQPATFACPICNGEAVVIGKGKDREFVCLDGCTAYEPTVEP